MGAITLEDLREVHRADDEFVARHMKRLERYLATQWRPVAGGDGEDDDDGDDGGSDDGGSDDDASSEGDDDHAAHGDGGSDGGDGGDDGDGDGADDDDDDDRVRVSRDEYNRLRKQARNADKLRRKQEREARDRREKEQRDAGRWEEIVAERDERIEELEAERDEARGDLTKFQRKVTVSSVASRYGAKDTSDVMNLLKEEDQEDEQTAERAIKRLQREKPYLFEKRPATGLTTHGGNGEGGTTLTMDQIKNMSQDEINARWDEVQKVMAASGENQQ